MNAPPGDWRPGAERTALQGRARLLARLRAYFDARDAWEVETPILSHFGNTDPAMEPMAVSGGGFLQTSPEMPMKRLLAAGSGDIYQIARVFRGQEQGRWHNPEFTLLEWYRVGWDYRRLSREVVDLLESLAGGRFAKSGDLTYKECFMHWLDVDPRALSLRRLAELARSRGIRYQGHERLTRMEWLDLLFSHLIQPHLRGLWVVRDYPAEQAAMARLKPGDSSVAERFEVFVDGVELANGYRELTDGREQRRRLAAENDKRMQSGRSSIPEDDRFLAAMEAGLPECSGVALGVDRLLALVHGADRLDAVMAFSGDRA